MCSLLAEVEGGRVVRIKGDPEQPFTAGFACAKVNRDAELVHSPERLQTPLRRIGAKGEGKFAPISWDEALDEIAARWQGVIAESGPLALLGYAYSAHQGQMNRGLMLGLFHALGASRLVAGTVCDTCCEEAWNMTVGPIGGADPEAVDESDLIVSWGADLVATNVHFWAKVEAAQKRGVRLVVIDPRRSRTARGADRHLQIRIGTDAALALGVMHILARDGLVDRDYIAAHTAGFDRLEAEVLPRFPPDRVAAITGLAVADIEGFAALYGAAEALVHPARRRHDPARARRRSVARGGAAARRHRRLWQARRRRPPDDRGLVRIELQRGAQAVRAGHDPPRQPFAARRRAVEHDGPAVARPLHRRQQPGGDLPRCRQGAPGPRARRSLHRRARPVPVGDRALCRYRPAGGDLSRKRGSLPRLRHLLPAIRARRGGAAGRGLVQFPPGAGIGAAHGADRPGVRDVAAGGHGRAVPRRAGRSPRSILDEVRSGRPIRLAPQGGQEFRTPSGRLEFYSEQLAAQGLAPMPDWQPDPQEENDAARWPLRLLTAPGYFQSHTAYSGVAFLRRREGPPSCILHPDEARRRGLADGARVRLFNERGAVGLVLKISDEVLPGVVLVPGQRPDGETVSGTVNILCSDRYTDLGDGATYQSTFLDVAAW